MKKITFLIGLISCWTNILIAQVVHSDSLLQVAAVDTVSSPSDTLLVVSDTSLVVSDSLDIDSIVYNSFAVSANLLEEVDSTALILEKVREVTDMISARSLLNSQLVKEVFSDTAIVNKYNRLLDEMVDDMLAACRKKVENGEY